MSLPPSIGATSAAIGSITALPFVLPFPLVLENLESIIYSFVATDFTGCGGPGIMTVATLLRVYARVLFYRKIVILAI
jgi:hypothetical protein